MMNQEQKNKTQSSTNMQLNKEELTKTQVLNLNDLEKVAKYEKKISKKPAIFIAIFGLLLIISGIALQYTVFAPKEEKKPNNNTENKNTPTDNGTGVSCNLSQLANADGTDLTQNVTLNFTKNQLKNYVKVLSIIPTVGNEVTGNATIKNILPIYQSLEATKINGYQISTTMQNAALQGTVIIDLTILDKTQITDAYKTNIFSNVEFDLNETKEAVVAKATAAGYTCN